MVVMMPKGKLSPEGEVIAANGAAVVAAFQVLINCLEENDTLLPEQFPDALGVYMEMVKSGKGNVSEITLAVLHEGRAQSTALRQLGKVSSLARFSSKPCQNASWLGRRDS
jgi:hypothetical protein